MYNLCIEKLHFPLVFKQAKVIPYFKSGDATDPSNYRPISILPVLSKPLEKHINAHILRHLNANSLLHPNQSGFRANHSCHTALISLVDKWLTNINRNVLSGIIFVDFAKAFDVIHHKLLIRKMIEYNFNQNTLKLITSFLSTRNQCVHINRTTSSLQPIKYGVPQGSVLGPLLFSIYINDLPLALKTLCELFADDTTIHDSHTNMQDLACSLQNDIHRLMEWTKLNHMVIHPKKTKCMLVTTRQKRQNMSMPFPSIYIDNTPIEEVSYHKVLGVIVDNNLSWQEHVNFISKRTAKKLYQLSKIKHLLSQEGRILFFNGHLQPGLDYCSTLWDSASENTLKPLVRLHKRAIKTILLTKSTLTRDDYSTLNILPLKQRFLFNKGTLMHRVLSGEAPPSLINNFRVNDTRNTNKVATPTPRLDLFKSSLAYSGSILWNKLPCSLRQTMSANTFKQHFKSHLFTFDVP